MVVGATTRRQRRGGAAPSACATAPRRGWPPGVLAPLAAGRPGRDAASNPTSRSTRTAAVTTARALLRSPRAREPGRDARGDRPPGLGGGARHPDAPAVAHDQRLPRGQRGRRLAGRPGRGRRRGAHRARRTDRGRRGPDPQGGPGDARPRGPRRGRRRRRRALRARRGPRPPGRAPAAPAGLPTIALQGGRRLVAGGASSTSSPPPGTPPTTSPSGSRRAPRAR